MNELKQWYASQPTSTRMLLIGASVMIAVFMLVEYAFDPWKANLNQLRQQVDDDISTVAWIESQTKKNRHLISQAPKVASTQSSNGTSLLTRVEQSAKKQKIYSSVERISPDKAGRVKVWINNADFQQWLAWVELLKRENIDVVDARINQSSAKAPVSINVTFVNAE